MHPVRSWGPLSLIDISKQKQKRSDVSNISSKHEKIRSEEGVDLSSEERKIRKKALSRGNLETIE